MSLRKTIGITLISAASLYATGIHAAAFGVAEQSALGLGNAFAGGAASAEDASTVWYNPAGMTRISGNQLVIGGHLIAPSFSFKDKGSTTGLNAAINADGTEDGGRFAVVPNLYYVHSLSDDLKLGIGINAPFGLATKYGDDWVGKYQAIESEIVTINVNPAIAWKASPELSLGFGINIQYIEATINNKIDFTTICAASTLNPAPTSTCSGAPGSSTNDGFSHLEADDISFGFNFGALYDLSQKTRIGFAYRSEIKHDLKGDADFTVPGSVLGDGGTITSGSLAGTPLAGLPLGTALGLVFSNTDIDVQPDLPASASISIHHQMNSNFAIMGDITWVGWSSIPNLTIMFDNLAKSDSIEDLQLKDNIRLSIGTTYSTDGPWTFRTGIAFDEGTAKNAAVRSARFPDNDRYWLAFGASYQLTKSLSIDTAYAHIFVPDTKINRVGSTADTLTGDYESSADILSAQLRWNL